MLSRQMAARANSVHAREQRVPGVWLRAYICRGVDGTELGFSWAIHSVEDMRSHWLSRAALSLSVFSLCMYVMLIGFHLADVWYPFSIRMLDLPPRLCNPPIASCDPPIFAETIQDTSSASAITRLYSRLPIYLCCRCALLSHIQLY